MSYKATTLRWLAPVALVGAVGLAACGDEDATESASNAGRAPIGSDQHLYNLVDELAATAGAAGSDQHLYNLADELAATAGAAGSDQHLYNLADELAEGAQIF